MATSVTLKWIDVERGWEPAADDPKADRNVEANFVLDSTSIGRVTLTDFSDEEKANAVQAFTTWLDRVQALQKNVNRIAELERANDDLKERIQA